MTRHPPIAAWQPNFGDKGIAVKSERRKGVSLWAREWSSSYYTFYWPFWLLKHPDIDSTHPEFCWPFFLSFFFILLSSAAHARLLQHLHPGFNHQTIITACLLSAAQMLGDKAHGKCLRFPTWPSTLQLLSPSQLWLFILTKCLSRNKNQRHAVRKIFKETHKLQRATTRRLIIKLIQTVWK